MQHEQTAIRIATSRRVIAGITLLATPLAQAHHMMEGATPTTFTEGLLSGLAHPVIGLDHLAFLVIVALLGTAITGTTRYLLPLGFVAATVAGTLYHVGAADLPMTETVIALSVLLGGVAVATRRSMPSLLLGALFVLFGVFHGYAYGESIVGAEQTPLLTYLVGFALIQYVVIVGTMHGLALLAQRSARWQAATMRSSGVLIAAGGLVALGTSLA